MVRDSLRLPCDQVAVTTGDRSGQGGPGTKFQTTLDGASQQWGEQGACFVRGDAGGLDQTGGGGEQGGDVVGREYATGVVEKFGLGSDPEWPAADGREGRFELCQRGGITLKRTEGAGEGFE